MPDVYEMNGSVRVQGRPGAISQDGENWCYTYTFLVNLSSDLCDLSIVTEDTGAAVVPGFISLNPDINPQNPPPGSDLRPGIEITPGTIGTDGAFTPSPAPGPGAPPLPRPVRQPVNGSGPNTQESADELKFQFTPCVPRRSALRIRLCFDEQLDENDFVTFIPSFADGSSTQSGDLTPATPLTLRDLIGLLGGVGGAVIPPLIGRTSNSQRRRQIAALVARDRQLAAMLKAPSREEAPPSAIRDALAREGLGAVLAQVPAEDIIRALGAKRVLDALGPKLVVESLGVETVVRSLLEAGLGEAVAARLPSTRHG